jgi:predicted nucleotidyltransferase
MKKDEVLHRLSRRKEELRTQFGVTSLSLFGSVIRNEAREHSDVDLLVEFDRPVGYFHLFHLQDYLENLLGGAKVDLVLRQAVINELQDAIYGEAMDALA